MFVDVLGVTIRDATFSEALVLLERCCARPTWSTVVVHFVNVDVMNKAWNDASFRSVLNSADVVLGDGRGVRWAARMRRVRLRQTLSSGLLVPALLERGSGRGRYCIVGSDQSMLERAAAQARVSYPRWNLVGAHASDGTEDGDERLVERVRHSGADVLLVGMGSPRQERWLCAHREALGVPLAVSVGDLIAHWARGGSPEGILARRDGRGPIQALLHPWRPTAGWRQAARWVHRNPSFAYRILRDRLVHST